MKKYCFITLFFFHSLLTIAQNAAPRIFPQKEINTKLQEAYLKSSVSPGNTEFENNIAAGNNQSPFQLFSKIEEIKNTIERIHHNLQSMPVADTIIVGLNINDTLFITGNFTHTGPIWVLNNGVLIFHNATVIDTGDIYVFGNGQLIADSSSLTFPQQYFYERGLIAVQNGYVSIKNCSLNYSGMSHNLVIGDSAVVEMESIHQNDWTTCGLYGKPTLTINGCNLGGEYILNAQSSATFNNVDTLILWHHFPDSSVINYAFPPGDTVYNYTFNNSSVGVSGVNYTVTADSCHNVMWAMMPVNGSDVTISNSVVRAIGAWFERGDSVSVKGLYDNSNYINFIAPLADRNLHLINSEAQTWSLYVFDSSQISIDSCQLGEVGCQQRATVFSSQFLLDGSGGYFWATDSSFIIAGGVIVYTTVRSEKKGTFILGYSWLPFAAPSAIGNSLLVSVQNNLAFDPVPYDNGVVWMASILQPDSAVTDSMIPIAGKAWIDQGPSGGWMFFDSYSLYYQQQGSAVWNPIVTDSSNEVHTGNMAIWNTQGLSSGSYQLSLRVKNTFGDSIEAIKPIHLNPLVTGLTNHEALTNTATIFPNPTTGNFDLIFHSDNNEQTRVEMENSIGEKVFSQNFISVSGLNKLRIDPQQIPAGIYFIRIISGKNILCKKVVVNK
jgi:Secretion system C-terminal sorting domain